MPKPAASFSLKAQSPARVARSVSDTLERVGKPAGGLVFVSGALAQQLEQVATEVAQVVRSKARGTPLLLVSGAGVLSEKGELEGQSAAAGVLWGGGRSETLAIDATGDDLGEAFARVLADRAGRTAPTVLMFARAQGFGPHVLEPLQEARGTPHIFGGGAVGDPGVFAIDVEGRPLTGGAVAMLVRGLTPPVLRASPACRLLMPLRGISEVRGSMVLRIEGEDALDVLNAVGAELTDQPLVFAVLAEQAKPGEESARPELVLRAVQGVDPVRRGLVVSDEVRVGMRLAFAVRDAGAARADLEAATRDLQRELMGAAPRFGVYVNCAGRGSALYGAYDVDTRILKSRFGDVPLAGMQSAFEIAPHAGHPTVQLYTGVVALFTVPS
jgi:small ligand-binding sensory domain FIST